MRVTHGRLWLIGGVLGAVALLAIGWLAVIGPQRARTGSLQDQISAAQLQVTSLRHRLADLRQQNRDLAQYQAQLARDRQALPAASGLSDLLRELHAAGDRSGVVVSSLTVGGPIQATGGSGRAYALPMTLIVVGTSTRLDEFLDQLQRVQPRAVLISTVNAGPAGGGTALDGAVTLTLDLQAFVAPTTTPAS